jgi:hypothetical protein
MVNAIGTTSHVQLSCATISPMITPISNIAIPIPRVAIANKVAYATCFKKIVVIINS